MRMPGGRRARTQITEGNCLMSQENSTLMAPEPQNPRDDPDPNTSAWFDRLHTLNPMQAMFTKQIVTRAGRLDVCTVCGDHASTEVRLSDTPYLRLRLCRDCQLIQQTVLGLRISNV